MTASTLTLELKAQHNEFPGQRHLLMTPGWRLIETGMAVSTMALSCLATSPLNLILRPARNETDF
jgi:hypothetical protein